MKKQKFELSSDGKKVFGRNAKGTPICNALLSGKLNRGTGKRCQRTDTFKNGRCRIHGKLPSGTAHYNYKDGKYSKAFVAAPQMMERYKRHLENPELLSMRDEIAVYNARIEEILSEIGGLDAASIQLIDEQICRLEAEAQYAQEQDDYDGLFSVLTEHISTVRALAIKSRKYYELDKSVEIARRLVSTEHEMSMKESNAVPAEKALAFALRVSEIVTEGAEKYLSKEARSVLLTHVMNELNMMLPKPLPPPRDMSKYFTPEDDADSYSEPEPRPETIEAEFVVEEGDEDE